MPDHADDSDRAAPHVRAAGRPADVTDPDALHAHLVEVCRTPHGLNGDGIRELLADLSAHVPGLTQHEVPPGAQVLDWTTPDEWTLRRATLTAPDGTVVADTDDHILHVVGHSEPVDATLPLAELEDGHLHSLPDQPEVIPWRTSYHHRSWGFCLPDRVRRALPDGEYRVRIDADLRPGHLTWGEAVLPATSGDGATAAERTATGEGEPAPELLVSAHICHPGMANDNASGVVVAAAVARALAARSRRRLTVRFLFAPGTIGAITWLARRPDAAARTVGALVLSGLADPGPRFTYKASRTGDRPVDVAMRLALRDTGVAHDVVPYSPWGYDERQYNSLGYDMGAGLLNRTPHGTYPEYHTSADAPSFVTGERLAQAVDLVLRAVDVLEGDVVPRNLSPHGEPQLGRRGLWPSTGGQEAREAQQAMLWVLALADGATPLSAIAERSGLPSTAVARAVDRLAATDLLEVVGHGILRDTPSPGRRTRPAPRTTPPPPGGTDRAAT